MVIGGLIRQSGDRTHEKVPILGDIPLIKYFFSRSSRNLEQKELAVFITVKILRSKDEKQILDPKKAGIEEVYVNLEKTAELHLVEEIYKEALALDNGSGLESEGKNEQFRKAQALNLYEHIFVEFPKAEKAPEAMYRAGVIYARYMKNDKKAGDVFSRLISDYASSDFAGKAKREYEIMEQLNCQYINIKPETGPGN